MYFQFEIFLFCIVMIIFIIAMFYIFKLFKTEFESICPYQNDNCIDQEFCNRLENCPYGKVKVK
jgi:hypothetical protein